MSDQSQEFFGKEQAESYDKRWEKLRPIMSALHLLMKSELQGLADNSKILCVGAGTGEEILALAATFPQWQFTAVDTSASMLDVCRRKVDVAGHSSRCDFHLGGVESLPSDKLYDAATTLLVSQFFIDSGKRAAFFQEINSRLKSGGTLISADLASPVAQWRTDLFTEWWVKMQIYSGLTEEQSKMSMSAWGKAVSVSEPDAIEAIIKTAGFKDPVIFYQALFIHAWHAKVV